MDPTEETADDDLPPLPDDVADAWAAVLIDVHEKRKCDRSIETSDASEETLPPRK